MVFMRPDVLPWVVVLILILFLIPLATMAIVTGRRPRECPPAPAAAEPVKDEAEEWKPQWYPEVRMYVGGELPESDDER